jgi:hypothetical protein
MGKKKTLTSCKVSAILQHSSNPILQQPLFASLEFDLGPLCLSIDPLLKE